MRLWGVMLSVAVFAGVGTAQTLSCSMQDYKSTEGVKAVATNGGVELSWQGELGQELRARFTQCSRRLDCTRQEPEAGVRCNDRAAPHFHHGTFYPEKVRHGYARERG